MLFKTVKHYDVQTIGINMTVKSRFSVIVFCLLVSPITQSIAEQHDSGDYFAQEDKGIILGNSEHSGESAPHTVSVVRPNAIGTFENHTYWIYVGEQKNGNIDLWFAEDIEDKDTWTSYHSNPIISGNQARWPTVLFDEEAFWMVHTVEYREGAYSVMLNSTDGVNFSFVDNVYSDFTDTYPQGYFNPFLFNDPNTGNIILLQQFQNDSVEQVVIKIADSVPSLIDAESIVIGDTSEGISSVAASMFFHNGTYWLLTEGAPSHPTNWSTFAYRSSTITGEYVEVANSPILDDNTACPCPYIEDDILYNFVCYEAGGFSSLWNVKLYKSTLKGDNLMEENTSNNENENLYNLLIPILIIGIIVSIVLKSRKRMQTN